MNQKVTTKKRKFSTNEILELMKARNAVLRENIEFVQPEQLRKQLSNAIKSAGYSINSMASECYITPSQLHGFLKGKKQMSRDKLLSVFITLDYSITRTQKLLIRFGYGELYTRNLRDFIILEGIKDKIGLDEINEKLEAESLESLCQK